MRLTLTLTPISASTSSRRISPGWTGFFIMGVRAVRALLRLSVRAAALVVGGLFVRTRFRRISVWAV